MKKIFRVQFLIIIPITLTFLVLSSHITQASSCVVEENFNSMPAWGPAKYYNSYPSNPYLGNAYYAWYWGGAPNWTIQAGGFLRASFASGQQGSSTRILQYNVLQPNTVYDISIDMRQPAGCDQFWAESAYVLGKNVNNNDVEAQSNFVSGKHFDDDGSNSSYQPNGSTLNDWKPFLKKFDDFGEGTNNGNNWQTYTRQFNSGNSSKITVGFKQGKWYNSGSCTTDWDNLKICPVAQCDMGSFDSPANNTTVNTGSNVRIEGWADDVDGISKVEIRINGSLVKTLNSGTNESGERFQQVSCPSLRCDVVNAGHPNAVSWMWDWTVPSAGSYQIEARWYDSYNNTGSSCQGTKNLTANALPTPTPYVVGHSKDTNLSPLNVDEAATTRFSSTSCFTGATGAPITNVNTYTGEKFFYYAPHDKYGFSYKTPTSYQVVGVTPIAGGTPFVCTYDGGSYLLHKVGWNNWNTGKREATVVFSTNEPPTSGGSIGPSATCTLSNGNSLSGDISGIYQSGLNNPITITTTHTDPNGFADISKLGISLTRQGTSPTNVSQSAYGTVIKSGSSYLKQTNPSGSQIYNNLPAQVISTEGGTNTQVFRSLTGIKDSGSIAFVNPTNITTSGNTVTVTWQVGLLNPGLFNGNLRLFSYSEDATGETSGWNQVDTWVGDLTAPTINPNPIPYQFASNSTLVVQYGANDNNSLYTNGYRRLCQANNIASGETIILQSGATTITHNSNGVWKDCPVGSSLPSNPYNQTYTVADNSNNGVLNFELTAADSACNETTAGTGDVDIPDPWLMTSRGDSFTRGSYTVTYPGLIRFTNGLDEDGKAPYFSEFLYTQMPNGNPGSSSRNGYFADDYDDLNDLPRTPGYTNWYELLKDAALKKVDVKVPVTDGTIINISTSVNLSTSPSDTKTYLIQKTNLTVNQDYVCNNKVIFLVTGNLILHPNITVDQNDDGCIFIVKGKTTITSGRNSGSTESPPSTSYDRIEAFILTDNITIQNDGNNDGLLVKGSIITNIENISLTNGFNRDLGLLRNQYSPAEVIRYDARYLHIFGDMFTYDKQYNIRESQFIRSINQ